MPYDQLLLAFLEYSPMWGKLAENAFVVIGLALLRRLHVGGFQLHTVGVEPLGALMHDAPVHAWCTARGAVWTRGGIVG